MGAEQRDRRRLGTVPARGEEERGVWAQGRSRREQGGREGQSRREQGGRDSPGASWEEGRELRDSCGLRYRKSSGTVDVDSQL